MRGARQDMTAILQRLDQHEWARTDRPRIERQIVRRHARLAVKTIRLPGDGRGKSHGQPILELWVLALDADAQRVIVERLHAVKAIVLAQMQPGQIALVKWQV